MIIKELANPSNLIGKLKRELGFVGVFSFRECTKNTLCHTLLRYGKLFWRTNVQKKFIMLGVRKTLQKRKGTKKDGFINDIKSIGATIPVVPRTEYKPNLFRLLKTPFE